MMSNAPCRKYCMSCIEHAHAACQLRTPTVQSTVRGWGRGIKKIGGQFGDK